MKQHIFKHVKIISTLLILLSFLIFLSLKNEHKTIIYNDNKSESYHHEENKKKLNTDSLLNAKISEKMGSRKPFLDPKSQEEVKSWFGSHGNYSFYGPDEKNDYQNYDVITLQKLSDAGDIRAMHVMADRATGFNELRAILKKAAIYGSTEAIIQLGSIVENENGGLIDKPPSEQKAIILEVLSYYEAAQMRGDWWGKILSGSSIASRYEVKFTEKDAQKIKERSQNIYDELQGQRTELGLGEFDNQIPDSVMALYMEMLKPKN